jgi:hypothetical protein
MPREAIRDSIKDTVSVNLDVVSVYPNGEMIYTQDFATKIFTGEQFRDLYDKGNK